MLLELLEVVVVDEVVSVPVVVVPVDVVVVSIVFVVVVVVAVPGGGAYPIRVETGMADPEDVE